MNDILPCTCPQGIWCHYQALSERDYMDWPTRLVDEHRHLEQFVKRCDGMRKNEYVYNIGPALYFKIRMSSRFWMYQPFFNFMAHSLQAIIKHLESKHD